MSSIEHRVIFPKPGRIVLSAALALATAACIVLIESIFVSRGIMELQHEKLYLGLALFAGALIGTDCLRRGRRGGKGLCALVTAAAAEIILIIVGVVTGQGSVPLGIMLWQILCLVTGGITDCIISSLKKRR